MKVYHINEVSAMDSNFRRNFINSLTGFKSVGLIGTVSEAGRTNLAIFSQIFHVGASPALIGVLFRPNTVTRHTLDNILSTRSFTINHICESFVTAAHQSSARYADDESEFDATGLTAEFTSAVNAPYVKESVIKLGLRLAEHQTIRINQTELVIGEVKEIIVPDDCVLNDGFVDLEKAGTVTSSGLDSYHKTSKIVRLTYAKPHQTPRPIG